LRPELLIRSKACAVVIVLAECCQEFCVEGEAKFAMSVAVKQQQRRTDWESVKRWRAGAKEKRSQQLKLR